MTQSVNLSLFLQSLLPQLSYKLLEQLLAHLYWLVPNTIQNLKLVYNETLLQYKDYSFKYKSFYKIL
jgi:hypothetical protein